MGQLMNGPPVRILLAEDNAAHAKLVMRTLAEHCLANTVSHVTDGEAALDYLLGRREYQNSSECPKPDVVLLDLKLPKIDGLTVLETIKSTDELRRLPVIILSTSNADSDASRAYELGANSYLVKPTDFAQFSQMIDDLGNYWLSWNRRPPAAP